MRLSLIFVGRFEKTEDAVIFQRWTQNSKAYVLHDADLIKRVETKVITNRSLINAQLFGTAVFLACMAFGFMIGEKTIIDLGINVVWIALSALPATALWFVYNELSLNKLLKHQLRQ
jgi:hypothetical protein